MSYFLLRRGIVEIATLAFSADFKSKDDGEKFNRETSIWITNTAYMS